MSRKKVIIALSGFVLVSALSSCSHIDSGTVTQKEFVPSYEYQGKACAISAVDQPSCHQIAPDTWYLTISAAGQTDIIPVSEDDFNSYEIYDFYDASA